MKKNFFIMTLALMAMFVISCTNDDLVENVDDIRIESPSHRLTAEQAGQNALDFVKKFKTETRAGQSGLKISDIKAVGINPERTRSTNESIDFDSLFYVVNFADNQGFVIAAADDREESVFAYVEEGTYEDETSNNGFNAFMDALSESQMAKRIKRSDTQEDFIYFDPDEGGDSSYPDKFEVMLPLLVTNWGQRTYNTYCPSNTPTGCVPTAISQICSYLKVPQHVSWSQNGTSGQSSIDWDRIINECSNYSFGNVYSPDLKNQIAHLMRFWGVTVNAVYDSDGTSAESDFAISKMIELGFNATTLAAYDATTLKNALKEGNKIVYMRGNGDYYHTWLVIRNYTDGHAWVVDGYIHSIKNSRESIYLHCNWGWGGQNGYFLSDVLNADENPIYDDNGNLYTRGANFRYRLKMSIISK